MFRTVLLGLLLTGQLPAEADPPDLATALAAAVTEALAALPAGAEASISVVDLADGRLVYRRRGDRAGAMASLTKLFVSAAALVELGPEYRFSTRLVGLGPLTAGGLPGLGIIGGGDPCLDEHFTDREPDRIFLGWIETLRDLGVQRIAGDLVVDNRWFSGPIRPDTYPRDDDNLQQWFSAPASALAWNDNCIEVRIRPGIPGKAAIVELRPVSPRITVENLAKTATAPVPDRLLVRRAADANRVIVTGTYDSVSAWYPMAIHGDPDLLAADHFAHLLRQAGIALDGEVRLGAVDPAAGQELLRQESPLGPALGILNQRSQNFYGEQIIRALGQAQYGEGSITAGCRAVGKVLATEPGIEGMVIADGSGLSYGNLASTDTITALLYGMHAGKHGAIYRDTLKEMWCGKVRCRVKTGSLAITRGLAGYIPGPDGTAGCAFALVLHRDRCASFDWAGGLRDRLFRAIVTAVACRK
jgi:D-alanyl-D-alanine carboxypeptidase/D-alanyl-D-alanine-endopeptidase (penicillin-binding protein 4)